MRKWSEYTRQEKAMMIVFVVLLMAVLLNWGRVMSGFRKGIDSYLGHPVDSAARE